MTRPACQTPLIASYAFIERLGKSRGSRGETAHYGKAEAVPRGCLAMVRLGVLARIRPMRLPLGERRWVPFRRPSSEEPNLNVRLTDDWTGKSLMRASPAVVSPGLRGMRTPWTSM